MKNYKISVIVCTYNNSGLLVHCLCSLRDQTLNNDQYEVIIVDNNSTDNTRAVVQKFTKEVDNFTYMEENNQGLSFARNAGWRRARGEFVAFIDDDAKAPPNWCQQILRAFENISPKPVAVGGPIYPWYETAPPNWFKDELEIRTRGNVARFLDGRRGKFGFSGSNMAIRLTILQKYEGFSTKFGVKGNTLRLGEDTEFFSRIYSKEPFFWYDPKIKVFHWTPIKKMRVLYRSMRSFHAGQLHAMLQGSTPSILPIFKMWIEFGFFILQLPYSILKPRQNKKIHNIRLIERIAYKIGYLIISTRAVRLN